MNYSTLSCLLSSLVLSQISSSNKLGELCNKRTSSMSSYLMIISFKLGQVKLYYLINLSCLVNQIRSCYLINSCCLVDQIKSCHSSAQCLKSIIVTSSSQTHCVSRSCRIIYDIRSHKRAIDVAILLISHITCM